MPVLHGRCWPWRALLASLLTCLLTSLSAAQWEFSTIVQKAQQRYGHLGAAGDRLRQWEQLLDSARELPESEQLQRVNRFFNQHVRFVDDAVIWGRADYWATPLEMLYQGAGDCEDYAIAKYFTLRQLGVSHDKLRITYVKALTYNQAHMVLTYYPHPDSDPLVLDNLIGEIRPASARADLLPVYAFNAEGLYMPNAKARQGDAKRLSRWQDILTKMRAEGFAVGEG